VIIRQDEIRHVTYRALNAPAVTLAGGGCRPDAPRRSRLDAGTAGRMRLDGQAAPPGQAAAATQMNRAAGPRGWQAAADP
jgi:hypothetical protein